MAAHRTRGQSRLPRLTLYVVAAAVPTLLVVGTGWALTPIRVPRILVVPEAFQDWTPTVELDPGLATQSDRRAQLSDEYAAARAVSGDYERDGDTVRFLGVEAGIADPRATIRAHLKKAGAPMLANIDSGRLGGAMACGVVPPEDRGPSVICGWADLETLGYLEFFDQAIQPLEAGELTRDFRAEAELIRRRR